MIHPDMSPRTYQSNPATTGSAVDSSLPSLGTLEMPVDNSNNPNKPVEAAVQPVNPPSIAHKWLLVLACVVCVASFAFTAVAVASPYIYTVTSTYTSDETGSNSYTNTYYAYIGPFWYQVCEHQIYGGDTSRAPQCTNNAGSAFVVDTSKMTMVQALVILSCVASALPAIFVIARAMRLLRSDRKAYAQRWDKMLLVALLVSSVVLLVTIVAVGSVPAANLTPSLQYALPNRSAPATAFALLIVALIFSVLMLVWYGTLYARGTLQSMNLSGGQTPTVPAAQAEDVNLSGVTYWSAHPWHKLPLIGSVLACVIVFALLVTVLASSSLYTAVSSSYTTSGDYGNYATATITTSNVGPFAYTSCTSITSTDPNSLYYVPRTPTCQSQQGSVWIGSSSVWSAIQAFLILSCLSSAFTTVLIVARALRFTMQRYYRLQYSSNWDKRLLAMLGCTLLFEAIALGLVKSLDVVSLLGGNWQKQEPGTYNSYYQSVGYTLSSSVPHLVSALSLTAVVLVWYCMAWYRGVLRAMQVDQWRLVMYTAQPQQMRYQQPQPQSYLSQQLPQRRYQQQQTRRFQQPPQQITLSPMGGDVSQLQAQLAAIKELYPLANIVIAPMSSAPMAAMPVQLQMEPMANSQFAMAPQLQQQYSTQQLQPVRPLSWPLQQQQQQQQQYVDPPAVPAAAATAAGVRSAATATRPASGLSTDRGCHCDADGRCQQVTAVRRSDESTSHRRLMFVCVSECGLVWLSTYGSHCHRVYG